MDRRKFVLSAAAAAACVSAQATSPGARIKRIRISLLTGRFHKVVAMNAYDQAAKGRTYQHVLIRIETRQGVEGIGAGTYVLDLNFYAEALRYLIGKDPLSLYEMDGGRIVRAAPSFFEFQRKHQYLDGPLFDLIGKMTGKPAWGLIGGAVRDQVDCYDGTLYFADVLHPERGVEAVVDEARESVSAGFHAIKLKLGRGSKWMERKAGDERDIAIVHAVRKAVGPDVLVMVDPNYGYDAEPQQAWTLLEETKADRLHWIEQPFKINLEQYSRLKDKMAAANIQTLIADGEQMDHAEQLEPYLKPRRLVDVVQLDARRSGFLGNAEAARLAEAAGSICIPHNWASQIGHLMGLHLAKAVKPVPWAEDDRSRCDVLIVSGYRFGAPKQTISNRPGLGIAIDEKVYDTQCKPSERVFA
ncbi:MAG: hypothetical protein M3Z85_17015 [Acidobacteriota bacterium]|nr:hypothetical protein [Acidobacteriota bacterium]